MTVILTGLFVVALRKRRSSTLIGPSQSIGPVTRSDFTGPLPIAASFETSV